MSNDFNDFQGYFKEYQKQFGLSGYKVYFQFEEIGSAFASISVNQNEMIATVKLNSNLPDKAKPFIDIKGSAKHEALHLLLYRLEHRAISRYVSSEEIDESVEEVVFKLEKLINDVV